MVREAEDVRVSSDEEDSNDDAADMEEEHAEGKREEPEETENEDKTETEDPATENGQVNPVEQDKDSDDETDDMEVETPPLPVKKTNKSKKNTEIRRGRELIINEKVEATKESANAEKMRKFMIHPANKRLYHKLQAKEQKTERKSTYLKERREAHEALKRGEITQKEYDYPAAKPRKLTIAEKKQRKHKKSVRSAVKFCMSDSNKNRDKIKKK